MEVAPSEKTGTGQNSMAKTGQFWVAINKVVEMYQRRMNIEVTFRDFKSQLGVRGLSLKVRKIRSLAGSNDLNLHSPFSVRNK